MKQKNYMNEKTLAESNAARAPRMIIHVASLENNCQILQLFGFSPWTESRRNNFLG